MSDRSALYRARQDAVAGVIASALLVFLSVAVALASRSAIVLSDTGLPPTVAAALLAAGIVGAVAGLAGMVLIALWTRLPR